MRNRHAPGASKRPTVQKGELRRLIGVLAEEGLVITGAEIDPDGTVRLISGASMSVDVDRAFRAWEDGHAKKN